MIHRILNLGDFHLFQNFVGHKKRETEVFFFLLSFPFQNIFSKNIFLSNKTKFINITCEFKGKSDSKTKNKRRLRRQTPHDLTSRWNLKERKCGLQISYLVS